jgi:hypothetical protein
LFYVIYRCFKKKKKKKRRYLQLKAMIMVSPRRISREGMHVEISLRLYGIQQGSILAMKGAT